MADQTLVCIIVHSYVKRLERFISQNPVYGNLGFDEEKINAWFPSQGGLSIYGLANLSRKCAFSPVRR